MKRLSWCNSKKIFSVGLIIFLISCSQKQDSLFSDEHVTIKPGVPLVYVFVPPYYCHGCLERTLLLLRSNCEVEDYSFISVDGYIKWKNENENLILINEDEYKASVEFDYKIYTVVQNSNGTQIKMCMDIEASFPVLDSLLKHQFP